MVKTAYWPIFAKYYEFRNTGEKFCGALILNVHSKYCSILLCTQTAPPCMRHFCRVCQRRIFYRYGRKTIHTFWNMKFKNVCRYQYDLLTQVPDAILRRCSIRHFEEKKLHLVLHELQACPLGNSIGDYVVTY